MEAAINYIANLCIKHKAIRHDPKRDPRFFGPNWDGFIRANHHPNTVVFRHPIVSRFEKNGGAVNEIVQFGFSVLQVNKDLNDASLNKTLEITKAIGKQFLAKMREDKKSDTCNKVLLYFDIDGTTTFEDGPHDHGYVGTGFKIPMKMHADVIYDPTQWL